MWLPTAGAGIILIEHRADDHTASRFLARLTHAPTRLLLDAERAALAALRSGCLTAASVHASLDEATGQVTVYAVVLDPAGGTPLRTVTAGPAADSISVGQRAGLQLLDAGADPLLNVRR
ncbi:hypothetical protein ABZ023_25970 [Streptomyces sp. NPDC006367]|uniref:hypothetical protein n=1 Tax=unclassified Streptomyces TaxID=2593676 RepID=UPI00339F5AC7